MTSVTTITASGLVPSEGREETLVCPTPMTPISTVWGRAPSPVQAERSSAAACCPSESGFARGPYADFVS